MAVSEVVSLEVLLEGLKEAWEGRLLLVWGTAAGDGADCSLDAGTTFDGFINWGVVVAGECISVEDAVVGVFMLGGVGGIGLVGGVGDCISKPPLKRIHNRIGIGGYLGLSYAYPIIVYQFLK